MFMYPFRSTIDLSPHVDFIDSINELDSLFSFEELIQVGREISNRKQAEVDGLLWDIGAPLWSFGDEPGQVETGELFLTENIRAEGVFLLTEPVKHLHQCSTLEAHLRVFGIR